MKPSFCFFVCAALVVTHSMVDSRADEPAEPEPISWNVAFSPISTSNPNETLIVILITNDNPYQTHDADSAQPLWCTGLVESAYRKALQERPDLKGKMVFQSCAAGLPKQLTGDQDRNHPSRAVVAICDGGYRLLSLAVGAPDADGMLTLIEDAQQTATMQQMHPSSQKNLTLALCDQNHKRLTRTWANSLSQMRDIITSGEENPDEGTTVDQQSLIRQIGRIGETLEGAYLADVKLRFSLNDVSDRVRLAILEQHIQTRQPWCIAIVPFVAATDFAVTYRPIIELIWKRSPVRDQESDRDFSQDELFQWWDGHADSDMILLALQPPILTRLQPWPPINVDGVAARKGVGWSELEKLIVQKPFRHVDTQQLANLLRQRDLRPIDIQQPSRARYVLYEPKSSRIVIIREGDLPAKYIGRIKRSL